MLFSSISFLYFFLPIVLGVYFIVPTKVKNFVLLFSSLFFYFWGEPIYVLVMLSSSVIGYLFGLLLNNAKGKRFGKLYLALAVVCTLAPLIFFKYSDFFLQNINDLFGTSIGLLKLALPIGISFYTFQILSYVIDVYRSDARVQKNPISFIAYVTLFPQLIAGPIVRYQTVQDELDSRTHTLSDFTQGIVRFCVGLGKKVLIANSLAELSNILIGADERSVLSYWICAIAYTFQIYFDFSGYSDMAIGLGRMFGFHFLENFNYPFMSGSITEFWRRWHMSLGTWFRDYVYIPLGGNRCSKYRWLFNTLVVWFLTGFWHGASWNFILWGLYFVVFLLLEKFFLKRILDKLPQFIRTLYVMTFIVFSFVLFNANDMSEVMHNFKGMFSFGSLALTDTNTLYYLTSYAVLLLVAAVGSTSFPKWIVEKICGAPNKSNETVDACVENATRSVGKTIVSVLQPIFCAFILLTVTAYLVDGSFNPFLYFRF